MVSVAGVSKGIRTPVAAVKRPTVLEILNYDSNSYDLARSIYTNFFTHTPKDTACATFYSDRLAWTWPHQFNDYALRFLAECD